MAWEGGINTLHLWKTILLRGQGRSRQMKKKERMGRGRRERGRFISKE